MQMLIVLLAFASQFAQTDWPMFGHDPGATRYSPLKQIDSSNVGRLAPAWSYHTGKPGSEGIPIVVNGVLYGTTTNSIFAVDPDSGGELWRHEAPKVSLRGLAYWPSSDPKIHPRVFTGSSNHLIALDAANGQPAVGFGKEGAVDLRQSVTTAEFEKAVMALQSPPAIFKDIVITGSVPNEGQPSLGAYGDIRGWDARTGKLLWSFHTVPRPGEPGIETWAGESWKNRSGTNAWGFLTVDTERGLVFVPLGSPTSDFYGADRHGKGLYGNSLVALDARTGALKWHQQLVHHDLWDYDLAAPPILITAKNNIPAVAQITKMGLAFLFDRRTGEPIFGMEERSVPNSEVPGEESWPTQPFPLKPPPLARNTFSKQDLFRSIPEHAAFCENLFNENHMFTEGPYTPMPLEGRNALVFPSTLGGGNWGGFSYDPSLGLIFTNVNNLGQWGHMEKRGDKYIRTSPFGPYARFWDPATRTPCTNPPFGELVAVDLNTGDIAWRTPLGRMPELEAKGIRNTGTMNLGGSIATAGGLVFIAATNDHTFRAFESKSGKLLWEAPIDANGHTVPITYQGRNGKQYVAIMAGGGGGYFGGTPSDSLIAFTLQAEKAPRPIVTQTDAPAIRVPGVGRDQLPKAPGRNQVLANCGGPCHDIKTVTSRRMNHAEWSNAINTMILRGAGASESEAQAIADYLAKYYGR